MNNLGPLFVHPSGPDYFWILIGVFAAPTIALCIYTLYRGQLPAALSSAGLVMLPIFSYVLGNLHVLDESKSVEFCGSCHVTMPPLVESMRADGDTLAAVHYRQGAVSHKEACYACHSGYGAAGDFNAKLAGVNHMRHTVMDSQRYPLKMRSTFDISSCLDCHAGSEAFREVKGHRPRGIQERLVSGEMSCTGACHASAHPPAALNGTEAWEKWKARL
jgi:cytochrome c nitrite reductase small subunit